MTLYVKICIDTQKYTRKKEQHALLDMLRSFTLLTLYAMVHYFQITSGSVQLFCGQIISTVLSLPSFTVLALPSFSISHHILDVSVIQADT